MSEKKSSEKSAKQRFLYSQEYRDHKELEKKQAKQFFQKHTTSAEKNIGKKICRKKGRNNFFHIHKKFVTKKS